jgi:hypothetical protein
MIVDSTPVRCGRHTKAKSDKKIKIAAVHTVEAKPTGTLVPVLLEAA